MKTTQILTMKNLSLLPEAGALAHAAMKMAMSQTTMIISMISVTNQMTMARIVEEEEQLPGRQKIGESALRGELIVEATQTSLKLIQMMK
jgi:hypothetical protein